MPRVWFFASIVPAFFALCATCAASEPELAAREQTFVVQSTLTGTTGRIGAGVVVASDGGVLTVVTAAHGVNGIGALRILDTSRQSYYDVIDMHALADYDLAFIRVRAQSSFSVQPPAIATPVPGQPVWVWGHTGNGFWEVATGTVLDTQAHLPGEAGSPRITITCKACAPGDSGSGVFDAQGRLLGILTKGWVARDGTVAFIEVEPAALILEGLRAADASSLARTYHR
jgi:S1-C subfamily serine protease